MAKKAKVLIISFSHLDRDPRIHRQILALKDHFTLSTAGYSPSQFGEIPHFQLQDRSFTSMEKLRLLALLAARQSDKAYWMLPKVQSALEALKNETPDIVLANDLATLPIAVALQKKNSCRIVFDAHEFAPREFESSLQWRLLFMKQQFDLCRSYLKSADIRMTVCQPIADEYEMDFGASFQVIFNAPPFEPQLKPSPVNPRKIRLIHHGGAIRERKIETMILMMDHLPDNYELNLMLMPTDKRYLGELQELAKNSSRIRFLDPVPMTEISRFLNAFDIGVYPLEGHSFNTKYALPNKLFEFIQGRLAIAIGPSPAMSQVVLEHEVGIVAESHSPQAMAQKIAELGPEKIEKLKEASHRAAQKLSFESQAEKLRSFVRDAAQRHDKLDADNQLSLQ